MDRQINKLLKKASFLIGALFLGWTFQAQAQSTTNNAADSTHHRNEMHRGWDHRQDGKDGKDAKDGKNGWASHRPGNFEHRDGHRRRGEFIHYTPEQRLQVAAINKNYRQKTADLFNQDNITLKQYKTGLVALQKEKKDQLAALLTPQQKDQLAARRKRMDENIQVMQAAHLERLKLRLNLSDDQVAKIKASQADLHNQVKAIHENESLLPQQKMEQMKTLLAKRNDTYKTVLTPEQYSQFEKMHEHGFGRPGGFDRGGRRFGRPGGPGAPDGDGGNAI